MPDSLVFLVEVESVFVSRKHRNTLRVVLDEGFRTLLESCGVVDLLAQFGDIVVDRKDTVHLAGGCEERNVVSLDILVAAGESDRRFAVACRLGLDCLLDGFTRLLEIDHVLYCKVGCLLRRVSRELEECLVCNLGFQVGIPDDNRHRVLLNDGIRALLKRLYGLQLLGYLG